MGKPNRNQEAHKDYHNLDQLVTHQQKKISKNSRHISTKKQNRIHAIDLFEEELSQMNLQQKVQIESQIGNMVTVINQLICKNKINNQNAFKIPIIDIDLQRNGQYFKQNDPQSIGDDGEQQMAWRRISSVLQNDAKIYGWRVDHILDFVQKIGSSLYRKDLKAEHKDNNEQKQKNKKKVQYDTTELLESQIYQSIKRHLDHNPSSFNSNLAKFMLRKDPTFEKTRRKFDQAGLDSILMNTLVLSEELELQIHQKNKKYHQMIEKLYEQSLVKTDKSANKEDIIEIQQNHIPNITNSQCQSYQLLECVQKQIKECKKNKINMHLRKKLQRLNTSLNLLFPKITKMGKIENDEFQRDQNLWKTFKDILTGNTTNNLQNQQQIEEQLEDIWAKYGIIKRGQNQNKQIDVQQNQRGQQNIQNKFIPYDPDQQSQNNENQQHMMKQQIPQNFLKTSQIHKSPQKIIQQPEHLESSHNNEIGEYQPILNINLHSGINLENIKSTKRLLRTNNNITEEQVAMSLFQSKRKIKQVIRMKQKRQQRPRAGSIPTKKKTRNSSVKQSNRQQTNKNRYSFQQNDLFNPNNLLDRQNVIKKQRNNYHAQINQNQVFFEENNIIISQPEICVIFSNVILTTLAPLITFQQIQALNRKSIEQINQQKQQVIRKQIQIMNEIESYQSIEQQSSQISAQILIPIRQHLNTKRLPSMFQIKQKLSKIIDHTKKLDFKHIYQKYIKTVTKQYERKCQKMGKKCNQANNNFIVKSKICFIAVLHLANQRGYRLNKTDAHNFKIEFI